jgi:hypothetical protein
MATGTGGHLTIEFSGAVKRPLEWPIGLKSSAGTNEAK